MKLNKVIAIVGPTGSGKTGVSIEIAREIGGEIISADSRAIYKGMDIGTAKPTVEEMGDVTHWGIDLVEPGERFTVADWKQYALDKIEDIQSRSKVAMVVGGTGLYVDSLIYDYQFKHEIKEDDSKRAQTVSNCVKNEQKSCSDRVKMDDRFVVFGIKWSSDELRKRLTERANKLFVQGLFDETEMLVKKYGWDNQAMKSNIYQFAWRYMQGEIGLEEAKKLFVYDDWHLAKRQITWFKRNDKIIWLPLDKIKTNVLKCIQDD